MKEQDQVKSGDGKAQLQFRTEVVKITCAIFNLTTVEQFYLELGYLELLANSNSFPLGIFLFFFIHSLSAFSNSPISRNVFRFP